MCARISADFDRDLWKIKRTWFSMSHNLINGRRFIERDVKFNVLTNFNDLPSLPCYREPRGYVDRRLTKELAERSCT